MLLEERDKWKKKSGIAYFAGLVIKRERQYFYARLGRDPLVGHLSVKTIPSRARRSTFGVGIFPLGIRQEMSP